MATAMPQPAVTQISPTLREGVAAALREHIPFSAMSEEHLHELVGYLSLAYYPAGTRLLVPSEGVSPFCFIIREGRVLGSSPEGTPHPGRVAAVLNDGECFPVGALLAQRPATLDYVAEHDTFCWLLPRPQFDELVRKSSVFFEFCTRRIGALLDISRQQLQSVYAQSQSQEHTLGRSLAQLVKGPAFTCSPDAPLEQVLRDMHARRVGSVIVLNTEGQPIGIFTRTDTLGRVLLAGVSLEQPVSDVMSTPVRALDARATAADAALLMAQHTIRHVPVMQDGQVMGVVSERDLFALQRLSLRGIGEAILEASAPESLIPVAADIRRLAANLVAQGLRAREVTRLVSHLNDRLTQRLVDLVAEAQHLDGRQFCWLALGSEGRHEQTISTDQDNGLIFLSQGNLDADRPRWLAMALEVNRALDACGFPLCKGGIMASNPTWCLSMGEWQQLFARWIDSGNPQSLLGANIFFDFRALAGNARLATDLAAHLSQQVARNRRFLKQMCSNALQNSPPSSWAGHMLDTLMGDRDEPLDLKMQGTLLFVDAIRIMALAEGILLPGSVDRLEALVERGRVPADEAQAWIESFEFLQLLRLRAQLAQTGEEGALREASDPPNLIYPRRLSLLDRRILKESFRQARKLQQRLELDYVS